jgi:hypothetical protein
MADATRHEPDPDTLVNGPKPDSPAGIVRRASEHLRAHVAAIRADIATDPYWNGDPSDDEAWRRGIDNAAGGLAGTFAALWTPGFAEAVADAWSEDADGMADYFAHFHAVPIGWAVYDEDECGQAEWTATVKAALAYLREDAPKVSA